MTTAGDNMKTKLPDQMGPYASLSSFGGGDPLKSRHENVAGNISHSVNVDVVPPTTKANFLSFLKVNCWVFHAMCVCFFAGSTVLTTQMEFPYGGVNPADFKMGGHRIVLAIVGVLLLARFASTLWRRSFFQLVEVMLLVEFTLCVFTIMWWSYGLPLLSIVLGSVLLNLSAFQAFWYRKLSETVNEIEKSLPVKPASRSKDKTNLSSVPSMEEITHLMGINEKKAHDHGEHKSGHFQVKNHKVKHSEALEKAYKQALNTSEKYVTWETNDLEPVQNGCFMNFAIISGWANTVVWHGTCILLGLWLGETIKERTWTTSNWACVILVGIFGVTWLFSLIRTFNLLGKARGIPVAEKEWLTYDLATGSHSRANLALQSLDASGHIFGDDTSEESGKSNLVYCWKCAFDVARRTGCTYLSSMCLNMAMQSQCMIEDLTEFEYRRPMAALWDITIDGVITQVLVTVIFIVATILYFGSPLFNTHEVPKAAVAIIGLACIGSGFRKTLDVIKITKTLSGGGDNDHRTMVVGESILLIFILFVAAGIGLFAFLLPMLRDQNPYLGDCKESFFNNLIPSTCLRASK